MVQQDAVGANVLVYAYQYFPLTEFEVVTEIDDAEDILSGDDDDDLEDAVANPDEYDGFIIRYMFSEVPYHALLYTPQDRAPNEGDSGLTLETTANYISSEQNLLQTRLGEFEGGDGGDEEEGTPEEETETETPTETEAAA